MCNCVCYFQGHEGYLNQGFQGTGRHGNNSLSRCPFVLGQGQEQKSRDKILCLETSRDVPGQNHFPKKKTKRKNEKDVLKQEKEVLKQEIWSFFHFFDKGFCPGTSRARGVCPGTFAPLSRDFPGQNPLSRDICSWPCPGTKGQRDNGTRFFFCPGTKGKQDVPWKP